MMNDCINGTHHSVQLRKHGSTIRVVTIRQIRALEEIYVPYGKEYWWFRMKLYPHLQTAVDSQYGKAPENLIILDSIPRATPPAIAKEPRSMTQQELPWKK